MKSCLLALLLPFVTHSAFAEPCRPLAGQAGASLEDCGGIRVLRLAGTPVERAHHLGQLLKSGVVSHEVMRYFTEKVSEVTAENAGWLSRPLDLAYNLLVRLFHRAAPVAIEEEVDSMAAGMGVDPIVLRRGLSLPDTGVFVQGIASLPGLQFLPATGCTSVAARLDDGGFAYGRNLDFAGVGYWDRHPSLLVVEPPAGSPELKHIVIGAEGLPFAGITGVNEAGLTFAVHQNYSRDISLTGVPMIFLGELVLRSAHNLDEAVAVLRENRPASQWTFVLTDLDGHAIAVESSPRVFLTRWLKGAYFAQTNHALHPETRERDNASYGILANSEFRLDFILSTLMAHHAQSVADLAKLLAYQEDPLGQLSAYHDVEKSETIQTVLFQALHGPKEATLSLSVDPAPTASGRFAEFSLREFWAPGPLTWEPRDYTNTPPEKRQRQRTVTAAYQHYFDEHNFAEAAALLAGQRTLDAALFRCVAMAELGRFEDSLRLADDALSDVKFTAEPAYIRDSVTLVKLISLIRLGRGEEARSLAESVVERGQPGKPGPSKQAALLAVARRTLARESIPAWRLAPHFDFFSGDLSGRKD